MDIQEIQKYFGTPISELAKPKTIDGIKFSAGFNGFLLGMTVISVVFLINYENGKFDDKFRQRFARQKERMRPLAHNR